MILHRSYAHTHISLKCYLKVFDTSRYKLQMDESNFVAFFPFRIGSNQLQLTIAIELLCSPFTCLTQFERVVHNWCLIHSVKNCWLKLPTEVHSTNNPNKIPSTKKKPLELSIGAVKSLHQTKWFREKKLFASDKNPIWHSTHTHFSAGTWEFKCTTMTRMNTKKILQLETFLNSLLKQ